MSCENNFYTMKGLVYTSDGTDYTELVKEELGLKEIGWRDPGHVWMQTRQSSTNSRRLRS